MKCKSCNKEISIENYYCEFCGTEKISEKIDNDLAIEADLIDKSDEIIKGNDNVYRWVYELNMWKNPVLLITILKVVMISVAIPTLFVTLLELFERGIDNAIKSFLNVGSLIGIIMIVIFMISYAIIAIMNGGEYCVAFEMDDKGVKHIQLDKQFKRSQILSIITAMAGVLTNNPTTIGAGLLANSKKSSYSKFSKVKNIKAKPNLNIIYLNESFERNQIYVSKEDFNVVYDYIIKRCKQANIK